MKVKIEIDDDAADSIVCETLRWHLNHTKREVAINSKLRNLPDYKKEELAENKVLLAALAEVYDYFGGNLK